MLFLTADQHRQVLQRLLNLGRQCTQRVPQHAAGIEYTSLMSCFLLHNLSAAETLLRILAVFGNEWYPVSVGYAIVRTIFEVDITAHYVTSSPKDRAVQYINFAAVLDKRQMDACRRHRNSKDSGWREGMNLLWQHHWGPREAEIEKRFDAAAPHFTHANKSGKVVLFNTWSGKSIRDMAIDVDHLEAYDIFYSELSSFTHGDVHMANRYLRLDSDGPTWSQRANDGDVGNVFRHAASFMTCFLELFGTQFKTCTEMDVRGCWQFEPGQAVN